MPFHAILEEIRSKKPLVHCISNIVTANDCANLLLAIGASPMMAQATEEMEEMQRLTGEDVPLGDVVICMDKIREQAEEFGHSEERETVYLFTHSVLHLLGYDHEEDEDRRKMRAREEEIMESLGISRQEQE